MAEKNLTESENRGVNTSSTGPYVNKYKLSSKHFKKRIEAKMQTVRTKNWTN